MKKKVLIILIVLALAAFGVYQYAYKAHRDIASEEATYTATVKEVYEAFVANDSLANAKYLDKTIAIRGKVTNIDDVNQMYTLDEKLSVRFSAKLPKKIRLQDSVHVKGRLVGFDDLLEEIQMDQCTVTD